MQNNSWGGDFRKEKIKGGVRRRYAVWDEKRGAEGTTAKKWSKRKKRGGDSGGLQQRPVKC